jgi:hypothetical protein
LVLLAPDGAADTRPAALLPFAAPAASASTVSADSAPFIAKTAIGFSSVAGTGGGTTTVSRRPRSRPGRSTASARARSTSTIRSVPTKGTRYAQNGSIVDIGRKPEIDGIPLASLG